MKKRHHTKEKILAFYAEWRQSGLCKSAYCEEVGLATSTFSYWLKKLKLHEQASSEDLSTAEFTQLHFPSKQDLVFPVLEIEYASGAKVKFYKQPEASWVKQLL